MKSFATLLLSLGILNLTACGGDPANETGNAASSAPPVKLLASTVTGSVATFTGRRADYDIVVTGSDVSITDKYAGSIRKMSNPTRLVFSDVGVAFDLSGPAGKAYRLYQAAFNRMPDPGGLGYWIDQLDKGVSIESVAAQFVNSEEFKALYGTSPSNREVITKFYLNVLHRAPEPSGFDFWLNVLDTNRASVQNVLADFGESAENQNQVAAAIANGIEYRPHKPAPAPLPPLPAGVYGVAPFSLNDFVTYSYAGVAPQVTHAITAVAADGTATLTEFGIGNRRDYGIGIDQAILTEPGSWPCLYTNSPGLLLMPAELRPGQRFTLPKVTRTTSCDVTWYQTETLSGTVSGPETVTVKAGTFSALRIDTSTDQFRSFENRSSTFTRTYWRDTLTGLIVKRSGAVGGYEELLSYAQASTGSQFLAVERMLGEYRAQVPYYGKCVLTFLIDLRVYGKCSGDSRTHDVTGTFNVAGDFTATVKGASDVPTTFTGRALSPSLILGSVNSNYAKGNFNLNRI